MPARNRKGLSENTRQRIQTTMIVKRLQKHIDAKPTIVDGVVITEDLMTQSQVTAALGLIKKTLPDLMAVAHSGEVEHRHVSELTDEAILARIGELEGRRDASKGDTKQADSKVKVH